MNAIQKRLTALREGNESGAALVSAVILMFFVFIVVMTLSVTTLKSTVLTADNSSNVAVIATAESGLDAAVYATSTGQCQPNVISEEFGYSYEVYRSAGDTIPTGLDDPDVVAGCPRSGDNYVLVSVDGQDERGRTVNIVGVYIWLTAPAGSSQGALVSGGGSMSISTLSIESEGGDLMLAYGNFNCNSSSSISGDLVIIDGDVQFSNACYIGGSLYASGNVTINNNAVGVGGDVYAIGNFSMSTGATIHGSVYTNGNINLTSNAIILGDLESSGTGNARIGAVTIGGNVRVAGPLRLETGSKIGGSVYSASTSNATGYQTQISGSLITNGLLNSLQASSVGGDIQVTSPGNNALNPTLTVGGNVLLRGTYSTYGAGVQANGTIQTNYVGLTNVQAPVFDVPEQLQPGYFKWTDYNPSFADWIGEGYQIFTRSGCDYQNNAAFVTEVNNLTVPTLIDISSCSQVNMYGITLNLKTDVSFYGNAFYAHSMNIKSADGQVHRFNLITPDKTGNKAPTCSTGQGKTTAYALKMDDKIQGWIYSPCEVAIGGLSTINGQVYAGTVSWSGGGVTRLDYVQLGLPGFPVETVPGTGGVGFDEGDTKRPKPQLVNRSENR